MPHSDINKRANIRFESEPNILAYISLSTASLMEFKPDIIGLLIEESLKGCGVIVHWNGKIQLEDSFLVQYQELSPAMATVKWVKEIRKNVYFLGLNFEDKK